MNQREAMVGKFSILTLSQVFFLLGVFFKQFYLFSSGGFQLGDFLLMCSFITLIFVHNHLKLAVAKWDWLIIAYVGCIFFINTIYIGIYGFDYDSDFFFHLSIIYYVFNLFIILTFRQLSQDDKFLDKLRKILECGLVIQLLVSLLGLGRYGSMRYMGTFNDPNQCGFYIFSSFLLIFLISHMTQKGMPFLWFIIAFYLIVKTASTGMMLGMCSLVFAYGVLIASKMERKIILRVLFSIVGVTFFLLLASFEIISLPESITELDMYQRVTSKIASFSITSGGGIHNLIVDRCWDRLIDYPEKILYGAGEGNFYRFPSERFTYNEIHSSLLGPLFYYGFLPCLLWFTWVFKQLQGLKKELWGVYIALILESITLVNVRQPLFWCIFVLAGCYLAKEKNESGKGRQKI